VTRPPADAHERNQSRPKRALITEERKAMKKYQRILVGTDFSYASEAAAHRGAELALHYGAVLVLLHVIEHFPEDMPDDLTAPENIDPATYHRDRARKLMEDLASRIAHKSVTQEIVMSPRSAKYEILHLAEAEKIGLIIVGSHGGGRSHLFGSTAIGVVHDAPCDVMVVRPEG
jgi:universal stress protein A